MKRRLLITCILIISIVTSFAACSMEVDTDGPSDSKDIQVKAVIAGYDVDWLSDIAAKFNEVYAAEGYKVNITQTDKDINAANAISTPKKNTTDIFFEYNNINVLINKSRAVLKKDGVALLEDLSDVFNSPAIGLDKKPQGKNIVDRMTYDIRPGVSYSGGLKGFDGLYGMPWQGGTNGIYINKTKLSGTNTTTGVKYDYTYDDLLTTDDLLSVVKTMTPDASNEDNLTNNKLFFPVSWSGTNATGYWDYLTQILFAQYELSESYAKFWDVIPDTGTTVDNGYDVYKKAGIYEALKVTNEFLNKDLAVPDTSSLNNVQAEARVAEGKSFMVVAGDYIYKELEKDYSDYIENVIAIKIPVISALGIKLDLCGKGTHAADQACANCNVALRSIVKDVDAELLTDAEIAAKGSASVTESKVKTVREARGYYQGGASSTVVSIPSYSDAKVGAKLFLRFLYSDESMRMYRNKAYVDLPLTYTEEQEIEDKEYVKAMYRVTHSSNAKVILTKSETSKLRTLASLPMFPLQGTLSTAYSSLSYSHSHPSQQRFTPKTIWEGNYNFTKSSWADYIRIAKL